MSKLVKNCELTIPINQFTAVNCILLNKIRMFSWLVGSERACFFYDFNPMSRIRNTIDLHFSTRGNKREGQFSLIINKYKKGEN